MNIISAFSNGLRATGATKKYILLAYILNFLLVAGLAASVANSIGSSVGSSQAGENLRLGFDDTWFQNYSVNQKDLAATFSPSVTGMGAIFNGLDQFLRGGIFENFLLLWQQDFCTCFYGRSFQPVLLPFTPAMERNHPFFNRQLISFRGFSCWQFWQAFFTTSFLVS